MSSDDVSWPSKLTLYVDDFPWKMEGTFKVEGKDACIKMAKNYEQRKTYMTLPLKMTRILLCGPGLIGSQVLHALLADDESSLKAKAHVTVLVRSEENAVIVRDWASALRKSHEVETIVGQFEDEDLLTHVAESHDVIIDCANAFNEQAALALATGMAKRSSKSYFLRTSGAAIVCDYGQGDAAREPYSTPCSDVHPSIEQSRRFDEHAMHPMMEIDNKVLQILLPKGHAVALFHVPLVYGRSEGPFKRASIQMPNVIRSSNTVGQVIQLGKGENEWSCVHVRQLGSAFVAVLGHVQASADPNPHYFVETASTYACPFTRLTLTLHNLEFRWMQLNRHIAALMHSRGLIAHQTVRPASEEEVVQYLFGPMFSRIAYGSNTLVSADHLRSFGWTAPVCDSLETDMRHEIEFQFPDI